MNFFKLIMFTSTFLVLILWGTQSSFAYSVTKSGPCASGVNGGSGSSGANATCNGWLCGSNCNNGSDGGNGGSGSNCTVTINEATATDNITINVNVSGGIGGSAGHAGKNNIKCGLLTCGGECSNGSAGSGGPGGRLIIVSKTKISSSQLKFSQACPVAGGSGRSSGSVGTITLDGANITSQHCR